MMVDQLDKFLIAKRMLDAGEDYGLVVKTYAQLWEVSEHEAEKQLTQAGLRRAKYAKTRTEKKAAEESTAAPVKPETEKPAPAKKKRSAPLSPIKWNAALEARVLAEWESGRRAADIARDIGATENAVRAKIRTLSAKRRSMPPQQLPSRPQPTPTSSPSKTPPSGDPRRRSVLRDLGRSAIEAYLAQFGLIGRAIAIQMFKNDVEKSAGRSQQTQSPSSTSTSSPTRSTSARTRTRAVEQAMDRLALATTRGVAQVAHRVDIMTDRVSAAMSSATSAVHSVLTHETTAAEQDAQRHDASSPSSSGTAGLLTGMLGLGALGLGMEAMRPSPAEAALPPANKEAADRAPPGPEQEHQLREQAESEHARSDVMKLAVREAKFTARKIVFDADQIEGLGLAAKQQGPSGATQGQGSQASAPPEASGGGVTGWIRDKINGIKQSLGMEGEQRKPEALQGRESVGPSGPEPLSVQGVQDAVQGRKPWAASPSEREAAGGRTLAEQRKAFVEQINSDPDLKEKTMALMLSEEGDKTSRMAVLETAMNRSAAHGYTDFGKQGLDPRYYAPFQNGSLAREVARVRSDPKLRAELEKEIEEVGQGSNYSNLGTQNASAGVAESARATQTITAPATKHGDQFSRKDRPEFAGVHGTKYTREEREWFEKTRAAMIAEEERKRQEANETTAKKPDQTIVGSPVGQMPADQLVTGTSTDQAGALGTIDSLQKRGLAPTPGVQPAPAPAPQSSIKDDLERYSVDRARVSSADAPITSASVLPSEDVSVAHKKRTGELDVIDPMGPTFGGGRAPVPGLDAELATPWA